MTLNVLLSRRSEDPQHSLVVCITNRAQIDLEKSIELLMVPDNEQRSAAEAAYNEAKKSNADGLGRQLEGLLRMTKNAEIQGMCRVLIADLAPTRSGNTLHAEKAHLKEEQARIALEEAERMQSDDEDDTEEDKKVNLQGKTKEIMRRFKS